MSVDIKFVPLTFIKSNDEILKQIKNTVYFSVLFNQFEETTLSHYVESTQYGYTASANPIGTHQLLRITDINNGNVNWDTVPFCNCDTETKYLLKDNDILIARTGGTTGKSFIASNVPSNAIFASYLIRLRLKKDVNIDFVNGFLNSYIFWSQIVEMKSGSAMPNVNAEKLKTLKIPNCDIVTQNKIAISIRNEQNASFESYVKKKITLVEEVFNKGNRITSELTHQLQLVKKLRQQLLQDAVQGKLVKQNFDDEPAGILFQKIKAEKEKLIKNKKFKKEKELSKIKLEEIPFDIPENWVWCRLGEICNYGSSPKAEPKHLTKETWVLDLEDIEKDTSKLLGKIRFNDRASLSTKSIFKKNQVLYSKLRPYLDKVIVADEDGVCTTEILPLDHYEQLNPFYLMFTLKSRQFLKYVSTITKGMKMPRLGTTEGRNALIPLPPFAEQCLIVKKVEQLAQGCDALEASIIQSQQQNEQLLQQVLREALTIEVEPEEVI